MRVALNVKRHGELACGSRHGAQRSATSNVSQWFFKINFPGLAFSAGKRMSFNQFWFLLGRLSEKTWSKFKSSLPNLNFFRDRHLHLAQSNQYFEWFSPILCKKSCYSGALKWDNWFHRWDQIGVSKQGLLEEFENFDFQ